MRTLKDKTVLVTGAARRIGKAIAIACGKMGANVVVHYNRSLDDARKTVEEIRALGVKSCTAPADLSDSEQVGYLIPGILDKVGPVDILVNSASIFPSDTVLDMTALGVLENFQINTLAPLSLARDFFAQDRDGCIINILDCRVNDYDREHASYHISKKTLASLTRMLALEFAPKVRVNAVAPGLILPPEGKDESYLESLKNTNPLQKTGSVDDVSDAVVFLALSEFITGQTVYVDGGRNLRGNVYG